MWDPQDGCEVRLWFQGEYEWLLYMVSEELVVYCQTPTRYGASVDDTSTWRRMNISFDRRIGWGFFWWKTLEDGSVRNARIGLAGFLASVVWWYENGVDIGVGCDYSVRLINGMGEKVEKIEDLILENTWVIEKGKLKEFYISKKLYWKEKGVVKKERNRSRVNAWSRREGVLSMSAFSRSKFSWKAFEAMKKYFGYLTGSELSKMTWIPVMSLSKGFAWDGVFEGYIGRREAGSGLRCMYGLTGMEWKVYPFENVCETVNRLLWSWDLYMQYEWKIHRDRGVGWRERVRRDGGVVRKWYGSFKKNFKGSATEDNGGFEIMRGRVLKWLGKMDAFLLRDWSFIWDNMYWTDEQFKEELVKRVGLCKKSEVEGSEWVLWDRASCLNWFINTWMVSWEEWSRIRERYLLEDLKWIGELGWDLDVDYKAYVKGRRKGLAVDGMIGNGGGWIEVADAGVRMEWDGVDSVADLRVGDRGVGLLTSWLERLNGLSNWQLWNYWDNYGWIIDDMVVDWFAWLDSVLENMEGEPDWDLYLDMGYESREEYSDSYFKYIGGLGTIDNFRDMLIERFGSVGLLG